ncbi:MAG TPA: hypothetical protein VFF29_02605 [Bacteroidota bacterium]|nr:hypothetical protein [Bacteroidota bacterium]
MPKILNSLTDPPPINAEIIERRHIYSSDSNASLSEIPPRYNRPIKRRKRSPIRLVLVLMTVSFLIVFYIWNKITVNRLVTDVNDLQTQYQKIISINEVFRAEVNKKSSLERIGKIALDNIGLTYPKEQPIWFIIDNHRFESLLADQGQSL